MMQYEELEKIANGNGGILTTKDVVSAGISKTTLANFIKKYEYERCSHGVYCSPDCWIDDMYILQLRCPQTVFSHETALYLLNMTDRDPIELSLTARTGYNPSHLSKDGVKVYTVKKELFDIGITEVCTPFSNKVRVYNPERTLCDIIRSRNNVEIQSRLDALKMYVRRKDKDLHRLAEYAELFHVSKLVHQYMEVLL